MDDIQILLVTPNPSISQFLGDTFSKVTEYELSSVFDIETAGDYFQSKFPDLVIVDVSIEYEKLLTFTKEITRYNQFIPVILITNENRTSSIEIAHQIGASEIIHQPLDSRIILSTIQWSLRKKERLEKWVGNQSDQIYKKTEIEAEKLYKILDGLDDGVIVIGDDRRVILVNQSARETFTIQNTDVVDKHFDKVFRHQQLVGILSEDDLEFPYQCEIRLDDGRVLNAQLTKIPTIGLAVGLQDITHLKELDRIKSDFVNTVSHDLRSPLTAILGYVDLISRVGPINNRQDEYIKRVQVSVRNITALVNDLLELGQIESGFDARKEFVYLPTVINNSLDSLGGNIIKKMHEVEVDIPSDINKVFGDPIRLRQLVDNLLSNAIRYTPHGGQIWISLRSEKSQVIFQVQDTGPGIPTLDQPYIFDKFYRASNVDKNIPGSGLGLAIVKTITENHQGRVWVDSILGQGSTFTVVLPTSGSEHKMV